MKLLLIRHGESEDDILGAYGGWSDFHLSGNGKKQIEKTADNISKLGIKFDKILSSPLLRAQESAAIISEKIKTPAELFEYVKERNTYGIMCGMVKADAKRKYPWLVEAYEKGEYVDGSEREEDVKHRAEKAFELIQARPEGNIAVLTHGVFLKALLPIILGKKLEKKEDGGFILLEIGSDQAKVLIENGIQLEQ
jgi:broad specificity phosphatase PhoE